MEHANLPWQCKKLTDQWRTALVDKKLAHYKVDIAALSETCLPDEGQLIECSCGYTFFWSGCSVEEWRESGVEFAIKSQIVQNLQTCQRESQIGWWLFNFLLGTTSAQQWSVHMHLPWLTQKRWRTGFTMNLIHSSRLSTSQINCFSLAILTWE